MSHLRKKGNNVYEKLTEDRIESLNRLKKEIKKSVFEQETTEIFKLIRISLGMTQTEMAIKLGLQPRTISRWESGETIPNLTYDQFHTLAYELRKLGVDFLNIGCYKVILSPHDIKTINSWFVSPV